MKQKVYGIDLLKVMACIGVVCLHTVNGSLDIVTTHKKDRNAQRAHQR